jgi:NAD(P)-dependent dehydrogenase (short-subunit alcohol dehydrogenase family)
MKGLQEKVVFITGGNSGIGKATALKFAEYGTKVAICARRKTEGDHVVTEIEQLGGEAIFVQADVSREDQVKEAIDQTVSHFGQINFAFNNAAVNFMPTPVHETKSEEWQMILDVQLTGLFFCMKYEIPHMLKIGKGAIVNMSSVGGVRANVEVHPGYITAKHGVIGMTKSAALYYADKGIRINAVCPAVTETPMLKETLTPEQHQAMLAMHPMDRMAQPEEVAAAAIWLCSDEASYIAGHALLIDGALTVQ